MNSDFCTASDVVLSVKNLNMEIRQNKAFLPILNNISFTVHHGEKWGIVGESGAGKSMLMYSLTSFLLAEETRLSGEILYRDPDGSYTDLLSLPASKRRSFCSGKTALLLQDAVNSLNPFERIYAQWAETVCFHDPDMKKADILPYLLHRLDEFGIGGGETTLRKYPHQLSGGMKQRIAIAMALESPAEILFADEPTTSLDAVNQKKIVDFIRSICALKDLTLLYISHNLGLIQDLCTHVLVIYEGHVVEQGPANRVFETPQAPYTRKLIRETAALYKG